MQILIWIDLTDVNTDVRSLGLEGIRSLDGERLIALKVMDLFFISVLTL